MKRVRVAISGRVQAVGFRYWTQDEASRRGLKGWVRNLVDGRVEAAFEGEPAQVYAMIEACRGGPRMAQVGEVEITEQAEELEPGFIILPTRR